MHILAQEEYGLRCLLQVARHTGPNPLTIPEIAEAEGLSPEYTAKLMRALRQSGLVTSTRGPGGGYRLAGDPREITAWDVIEAIGGTLFPDGFCDSHPGVRRDCVHTPDCSIRALWRAVEGSLREVLDRINLADLKRQEDAFAVWVDTPPLEGSQAEGTRS
jgi:Rrf2 family protein